MGAVLELVMHMPLLVFLTSAAYFIKGESSGGSGGEARKAGFTLICVVVQSTGASSLVFFSYQLSTTISSMRSSSFIPC